MESEGDIYADIPDDPETAFLRLEAAYRHTCREQTRTAHHEENHAVYWVEYISRALAAIDALNLEDSPFSHGPPSIHDVDYNWFLDFCKDVDHYTTKLRIRHARRAKGFSVKLDDAAKKLINHLLDQLRDTFGKLELPENKRDSLLSKLEALQLEVDRSRTRLEVYGDLVHHG